MVGLVAAVAIAGAVYLLSLGRAQSARGRERMISETAAEIRGGNYFAWKQAERWDGVLSAEEKRVIGDACREYGRTNAVVDAKDRSWPPGSKRMRAARAWVRDVLHIDGGRRAELSYEEVMCFPAFYKIPVSSFEWMMREWK